MDDGNLLRRTLNRIVKAIREDKNVIKDLAFPEQFDYGKMVKIKDPEFVLDDLAYFIKNAPSLIK